MGILSPMKLAILALSFFALSAFAQDAAPPPPPDTVLATVDGHKVTYREVDDYFTGLGPEARQNAFKDKNQMIEQYAMFLRLIEYALAEKLDEKKPYSQTLAATRMALLAQAAIADKSQTVRVTPEDQRKFYDANQERYSEAKVQVIYLGYVADPAAAAKENPGKTYRSETEAKAKILEIAGKIKTREDFIRLAKESSEDEASKDKDAEFGTVKKSDNIPNEIKQVIFSLKQGEVSGPVAQRNGFYLFRVDAYTVQSYESVKDSIFTELQTQRAQAWLEEQRRKPIQIEDKAFFGQK
jgi:parvulin-like peptidyl-prolyl isomerase